jgi:NifB/MoaA-like Fe-S oxidoreductase
MSVKIASVSQESKCYKKGIRPGDMLLTINGNEIKDILDYRFYITERKVKAEFQKQDGGRKSVTIRKDQMDDIGLDFETYLMDRQRACKNKCIFCFVDQLPEGMRDSLYFKDDDDRLSFLFGN